MMGEMRLNLRWLSLMPCYTFFRKSVNSRCILLCWVFICQFGSVPGEWSVWFSRPRHTKLIPDTSGSAPPTSLNRALKTTSDFRACCPTPGRQVVSGLAQAWELRNPARACSTQTTLEVGTSSHIGLWLEVAPAICRGKPCGACGQWARAGKESVSLLPGGM